MKGLARVVHSARISCQFLIRHGVVAEPSRVWLGLAPESRFLDEDDRAIDVFFLGCRNGWTQLAFQSLESL